MSKLKHFLCYIGIIVLFAYCYYSVPLVFDSFAHQNYIEFNNKKYSVRTIKKENPILFYNYKQSMNEALERVFRDFYTEKIIKLELKKKGLTEESELFAYTPTEQEMRNVYKIYKNSLQGKSFNEVKEDIRNFVIQEKRQSIVQDLYQKYPSQLFLEELPETRIEVAEKNNPFIGSKESPITVIEFFDLECPFCQKSQVVNAQIREKYKGKIKWVVRDFPLSFHRNAMFAHKILNCFKGEEEKYWKAFNKFFTISQNLQRENVISIAKELGLNDTQINQCNDDKSIEEEIKQDLADGQRSGVNGTPAFFVNGIMLSGARSLEDFSEVIDKELKKLK